jgi:hypothetical protein
MANGSGSLITCPKCAASIPLDETLAGPAIAKIREEAAQAISSAKREAETAAAKIQAEKDALAQRQIELTEREASLQAQVNQAVAEQRSEIVKQEREAIQKESASQLAAEREKATRLAEELETAQNAELQLRQEKDHLDARAKQLDLEVARLVDSQRRAIEERVTRETEDEYRLRMAEKDKTIADMRAKLEEANRKAIQGSQQLQGEVMELEFEYSLQQAFPQDLVEAVKTGVRGGDVLQHILGQMNKPAGTIFWETKRAQSWGSDWAAKARHDAAASKAEVAVIVSEVLPKGVRDFAYYDGVWVTRPCFAGPLGIALRHGIIACAEARQGAVGRESKKDRLYTYMTGPEFRVAIESIALPFKELHDELAAEKRSTLARWRRQERRIERVLTGVATFQGDLQGLVGSEIPAIEGFEMETIDDDLAAVTARDATESLAFESDSDDLNAVLTAN